MPSCVMCCPPLLAWPAPLTRMLSSTAALRQQIGYRTPAWVAHPCLVVSMCAGQPGAAGGAAGEERGEDEDEGGRGGESPFGQLENCGAAACCLCGAAGKQDGRPDCCRISSDVTSFSVQQKRYTNSSSNVNCSRKPFSDFLFSSSFQPYSERMSSADVQQMAPFRIS